MAAAAGVVPAGAQVPTPIPTIIPTVPGPSPSLSPSPPPQNADPSTPPPDQPRSPASTSPASSSSASPGTAAPAAPVLTVPNILRTPRGHRPFDRDSCAGRRQRIANRSGSRARASCRGPACGAGAVGEAGFIYRTTAFRSAGFCDGGRLKGVFDQLRNVFHV